MLHLLLALLTKYMCVVTNVVKNPRRIIQRGWRGSAIQDYVAHGDKQTMPQISRHEGVLPRSLRASLYIGILEDK